MVLYRWESGKTCKALHFSCPPVPHLWPWALPWHSISAASPRPEVKVTIHDGVHAGVGAGEEEQSFLNSLVHHLRRRFVYPVPVTLIEKQIMRARYPVPAILIQIQAVESGLGVSLQQQHERRFYPDLQYSFEVGSWRRFVKIPATFFFSNADHKVDLEWHKVVVQTTTVLWVFLFPHFCFSSHPSLLPTVIAHRRASSPLPPTTSSEASCTPIYSPPLTILKYLNILMFYSLLKPIFIHYFTL